MSGETLSYSARVQELFRSLPGAGPLAAGPGPAVAGEAMALDRGAWVRIEARVVSDRIVDCAFTAWGCPHLLAAVAWTCGVLRGLAISQSATITAARLADELAAPAEKMGRLLVVEDALAALRVQAAAIQSG